MRRYTSTKSGAALDPSQAVLLHVDGVGVLEDLRDEDGNLLGETPWAILSRDEFRELLTEINSPASLASSVRDR